MDEYDVMVSLTGEDLDRLEQGGTIKHEEEMGCDASGQTHLIAVRVTSDRRAENFTEKERP